MSSTVLNNVPCSHGDDMDSAGDAVCMIVPPHLLQAICDSTENSEEIRTRARGTLEHYMATLARRRRRHQRGGGGGGGEGGQGGSGGGGGGRQAPQGIVPDHLLSTMAESEHVDDDDKASAQRSLLQSQAIRDRRQAYLQSDVGAKAATAVNRAIYSAANDDNTNDLPGNLVRSEGQPSTTTIDEDVNDCYDNFGHTFDFYANVFGRISVDDKDLPLIGTVHFGYQYANAFWDGQQMVFGDGNTFLYHFCQSLDVIGHELTHGVTQYTCALEYSTQSGALNESISDVFGSLVKQYAAQETADQADWLIGEGCLFPGVKGVALRSMKAPGTAYNDPRVGKDNQPATMSGYVDLPDTPQGDNGGVHINSGIPNHAFYLAAVGFGGFAWEKAGLVWYRTITSGMVPADCDFKTFANLTVTVAGEVIGADGEAVVKKAWTDVEVLT